MSDPRFHPRPSGAPEGGAGLPWAPTRKVVPSARLLDGAREITIRHEGQDYRLQVTRNGKLILTK